ncbi:unannotated protein [freshwater metagenome]|uniref:Unannotated protein n=1 Tax=freshwater metagenome TaxID=449393 RepID=A0A6J6Q5J0_9ZZZZ
MKTCSTRASTSLMMSSRSSRDFFRSSSCSLKKVWRSSMAENSSRARGLILPRILSSRSAVLRRFSCSRRTYGYGCGSGASAGTSSPGTAGLGGTNCNGPYSAINTSPSTPKSSSAFSSSCSIRRRCSARAISSRCTLSFNRSNSPDNSRILERSLVSNWSRSAFARSTAVRSRPACATEPSIRASAIREAARIACAVTNSRARRSRLAIAFTRAWRSAPAARSSCSALTPTAPTRSSPVRSASRASTSS